MEMKKCRYIDAPLRMVGTLFLNVTNVQSMIPKDQQIKLKKKCFLISIVIMIRKHALKQTCDKQQKQTNTLQMCVVVRMRLGCCRRLLL